jgi:hypothetical protein
MIWEEYLVPLICIAFTSGVVIGINIAMLCSTRFSSKQPMPQFMPAPYPNNKYQQQQQVSQNFQQSSPMQYPSGYLQHPNYQSHINNTTSELTANDFRRQQTKLATNRRHHRQNNSISFG